MPDANTRIHLADGGELEVTETLNDVLKIIRKSDQLPGFTLATGEKVHVNAQHVTRVAASGPQAGASDGS
jgi:hypothetical protein